MRSYISNFKNRLIVTLALSGILTIIVGLLRPQKINSVETEKTFWMEKVYTEKKFDIIFVGDSRTYTDIDPLTIKKYLSDTSLTVLNFGFKSAGFNNDLITAAAQKLNNDSKVKILVFGITPHSFSGDGFRNEHLKELQNKKQWDIFESRFVNPSLKFFEPITYEDILFLKNKEHYFIESYTASGWVSVKKNPVDTLDAMALYKRLYENNDSAHVTDENLDVFYQEIKKLSDSNIISFAYRNPTSAPFKAYEDKIFKFNEANFIENFQKNDGIWMDVNKVYYKTYDGHHLINTEAQALSKEIALLINEELKKLQK